MMQGYRLVQKNNERLNMDLKILQTGQKRDGGIKIYPDFFS